MVQISTLNPGLNRTSSLRQQQFVIFVIPDLSGSDVQRCNSFVLSVNVGYTCVHMYIHLILFIEAFRALENQFRTTFYVTTYIIGEATIGKRNVGSCFKHRDTCVGREPANLCCSCCSGSYTAYNNNFFHIYIYSFACIVTFKSFAKIQRNMYIYSFVI